MHDDNASLGETFRMTKPAAWLILLHKHAVICKCSSYRTSNCNCMVDWSGDLDGKRTGKAYAEAGAERKGKHEKPFRYAPSHRKLLQNPL